MRKVLFSVFILIFSLSAETLISDDFESGTGNWTLTGNWGLEEGVSVSGSYSLTESPGGNYTANNTSTATWITSMNLTESEFATVVFWLKYDLEDGFDYLHFEISYDNGSSWERKRSWTGQSGTDWIQETIFPISAFSDEVIFRFLFHSDKAVEKGGTNIDDIVFSSVPESHETFIYHDGPEFYEVPYGVYESYIEVYDFDGIDSVFVEYSVNFSETYTRISAVYAGSNIWNFAIPEVEPAGNFIEYHFRLVESSEEHLIAYSRSYIYITGEHNVYDSGCVSYYLPIESNDAIAVKFDRGSGSWYLAGALIRNYADLDHLSADMQVHIFDDDNGAPGIELMNPIDVTPAANISNQTPFTWVDLSYIASSISGDYYWVVVTAPYGTVYTTIEDVDDPEVTAYERSCIGAWTGSEWYWTDQPQYNYHIRTVCGYKTSIEEGSEMPETSILHQNYPNPFNPQTEISYSLQREGQVTLSVFNTKGELVSSLVNAKKSAGNHSVNFNGEALNSGIYFYKLEVNRKLLGSKRTLLIK
jgi:hypothetical protein